MLPYTITVKLQYNTFKPPLKPANIKCSKFANLEDSKTTTTTKLWNEKTYHVNNSQFELHSGNKTTN